MKNVGGDRVEVATLVGPNGNAHVYEPSPADSRRVADASVVFMNGLGFEGWLDRLVEASGTQGGDRGREHGHHSAPQRERGPP